MLTLQLLNYFVFVGIETSWVLGVEVKEPLLEVGHQMMRVSGEPKSYDYSCREFL